jgi:hypothetical protein
MVLEKVVGRMDSSIPDRNLRTREHDIAHGGERDITGLLS